MGVFVALPFDDCQGQALGLVVEQIISGIERGEGVETVRA
jgi:hypothetical protein